MIGAGVGVATAGAIAFLVATGHPVEESGPRELPRPAPLAAPVPKTAPGNAELDPAAKPAPVPKKDDDAKAKAEAETQAKADGLAKVEEARKTGILGSTALKQGGAFASLTKTGNVSSGFDDTHIYGGLLGGEAGEMNGGFGYGRSGFGPGGGGTGWGTIGTGGYGTIGKGGGGGTGDYGTGARRRSAMPTISIGQPSVVPVLANADEPGNLDKAIIRRYIKRNAQKLQYCYEKELLAKSNLAGTVATSFTIMASGQVGGASATGVDTEVASCVANVIRGIEFPRPKGQGGVAVTYPFTFRPAGS